MKPAIASLFALGTTFCLMGTKTRHEVPTFGTSAAFWTTSTICRWAKMPRISFKLIDALGHCPSDRSIQLREMVHC